MAAHARMQRGGPRPLKGRPAPEVRVGRVTRAERVNEIERLRAEGLSAREIGERLGLATSTIHVYRADPTGERQRTRREEYRGTCRSCAKPTSGSAGRARAAVYCARCARSRQRVWTEERIVAAVRDWHTLTGAPPTVSDWSPAHAPRGHPGAALYLEDPERWPSAGIAARRFGSFRAAVAAAGLTPVRPGPRPGARSGSSARSRRRK